MALLENIAQKSLIEQIEVFEKIEQEKNQTVLPALFSLYSTSGTPEETLFFGLSALKALLSENSEKVIEGLGSGCPVLIQVCLDIVSTTNLPAAVPALLKLLESVSVDTQRSKILTILSEVKTDDTVKLFRSYIDNEDSLLSSLAIETLGNFKDDYCIDRLFAHIDIFLSKKINELCEMVAASSLIALGKIGGERAINYLVSIVHAQNPTVRQVVHEALRLTGVSAVPYLKTKIQSGNLDDKIMAVDILGSIKHKKCVDVLVEVLDSHKSLDTNLLCAIYNALGGIPSMKSIVFLTEALHVEDVYVLTAVVTSLNSIVMPEIIEKFVSVISVNDKHSRDVARAVIVSQSTEIFKALTTHQAVFAMLLQSVIDVQDNELTDVFLPLLDVESKKVVLDAIALKKVDSQKHKTKLILAVDDSKSIIAFYRGVIAELKYTLKTAENGEVGLKILSSSPDAFDLIFVDMNMPVMNGIEFTQKVRQNPDFQNIPIIMATTETDESQKTLATKAGVNDFISKPFNEEILIRKIKMFVKSDSEY